MKKKFLVSIILLVVVLFFTSYCFANDNMISDVKNGAQNLTSDVGNVLTKGVDATKNTATDIGQGVDNVVSDIASGVSNTSSDISRDLTNSENNIAAGSTDTNNGGYTASRTAMTDQITFAGMTATGWTWFIVAVFGVAILALVWFYGKQHTPDTNKNIEE